MKRNAPIFSLAAALYLLTIVGLLTVVVLMTWPRDEHTPAGPVHECCGPCCPDNPPGGPGPRP